MHEKPALRGFAAAAGVQFVAVEIRRLHDLTDIAKTFLQGFLGSFDGVFQDRGVDEVEVKSKVFDFFVFGEAHKRLVFALVIYRIEGKNLSFGVHFYKGDVGFVFFFGAFVPESDHTSDLSTSIFEEVFVRIDAQFVFDVGELGIRIFLKLNRIALWAGIVNERFSKGIATDQKPQTEEAEQR